jgi:hypothetical protein
MTIADRAVLAADVADPVVAGSLIEQYIPKTLVLNAGAPPLMRPIQHQTWQTFSRNWEGLDIRFVSVIPQLTLATGLGAAAAAAYAKQEGIGIDEFVSRKGPPLEPQHVGREIADLASSTDPAGAYLLTPDGLSLLP